jgi:hypothetical protein
MYWNRNESIRQRRRPKTPDEVEPKIPDEVEPTIPDEVEPKFVKVEPGRGKLDKGLFAHLRQVAKW